MKNNINNTLIHACLDLAGSMETAACGIVALGELMIAADPELIESQTLSGLGHLLAHAANSMLGDSDQYSQTARNAQMMASKSKRVRKA